MKKLLIGLLAITSFSVFANCSIMLKTPNLRDQKSALGLLKMHLPNSRVFTYDSAADYGIKIELVSEIGAEKNPFGDKIKNTRAKASLYKNGVWVSSAETPAINGKYNMHFLVANTVNDLKGRCD